MVLAKGLRPIHVAALILLVKLASVFLVQTWYVPDEYWQTLEVAHKQVFGYGELTWEWKEGIRSYFYPSVVSALYAGLKITGLDYPEVVVLAPRILQAIISAVADYSFYKWCGERKWALFLMLTSWFWFYTCSRTLLQTLETAFVAVGLSLFPFKDTGARYYDKESSLWLLPALASVFVRPTSAPLWAVLAACHVATTNQGRLRLVVRTYVPYVLAVGGLLTALDCYCYGRLVLTPWEFFRHNVLNDVGSFYGQHPWYWYLTTGLPAVLGTGLVPVAAAVYSLVRRRDGGSQAWLLAAVAAHVAVYSFIPHKEFRFLLPLLPALMYLAQDATVRWSRKAPKWQLYLATAVILVGNLVPALYFGLVHQAGALRVMPALRDALPSNRSSVLFLMPCHSTPLYSHLHINATARYLHCEPSPGRATEAEAFFNGPLRWWREQRAQPDVLVMYDSLRGRLDGALGPYDLHAQLAHTQFPEGEVGENVLVFKKKAVASRPADAAA